MNEWIPVTERLPENAKSVLITYGCGEMLMEGIAWFTSYCGKRGKVDYFRYRDPDDGKWYNLTTGHGVQRPYEVLAWMPLPEPYKRKGEVLAPAAVGANMETLMPLA